MVSCNTGVQKYESATICCKGISAGHVSVFLLSHQGGVGYC